MIELIFVLIILELVFGIYLIVFMDKKIRLTEEINKNIVKSGFKGNLTECKLKLKIFNAKLQAILEEKIEQERAEKIEKAVAAVNSLLLGFSLFKFLGKKNNKNIIKHK